MRMYQFIMRRLALLVPVLIGVSIIVFALTRLTGDPAAAYINNKMSESQIQQVYETYHFNDPPIDQYWYWLNGIFSGDWGFSKSADIPVLDAISQKFAATFELTAVAIVIAVFLGIWMGTVSAVKRNKPFDHITRVISLTGVSLPIFVLGLILLYIFSFSLGWFPPGGRYSNSYIFAAGGVPRTTGFLLIDSLAAGNFRLFIDAVWHLALPAITLAFSSVAIITRIMRNSMLEVLGLDYVKTARTKGLSERLVTRRHARKNALIPTTTVVGLAFGGLLGGAVLTESIFRWPGLGQWSAQAISGQDISAILGFVLLTAIVYVIANLIVDVLYAYLDPRVRLE